MVATASMMGLVAGLAPRWAALPRLALFTIVLYAIPFCIAGLVADGGSFLAGPIPFLIVTTGPAAPTPQHHRPLVAPLRPPPSDARGVGNECVTPGASRWQPHTTKQ